MPLPVLYQPDAYTYEVEWSTGEEAYVATVSEFPSLQAHGADQEIALAEIHDVVRFVLENMREYGEAIPVPLASSPSA
jgi:predicted RNase H-like HicB family nuclease